MPKRRPDRVSKIINQVLNRKNIKCGITEVTIQGKKFSGVSLAKYFNTNFVRIVKPLNNLTSASVQGYDVSQTK